MTHKIWLLGIGLLFFTAAEANEGFSPKGGLVSGGNKLEITLPQAKSVTKVLIGDLECGYLNLISDKELECTIPPQQSGPVTVAIYLADMQKIVFNDTYTYFEPLSVSAKSERFVSKEVSEFAVSGGVPPYNFAVSGPGEIDPKSGKFTAVYAAGQSTSVIVEDSFGNRFEKPVTVAPSFRLTLEGYDYFPPLYYGVPSRAIVSGGYEPYQISASGECSIDSEGRVHASNASKFRAHCLVTATDADNRKSQVEAIVNYWNGISDTSFGQFGGWSYSENDPGPYPSGSNPYMHYLKPKWGATLLPDNALLLYLGVSYYHDIVVLQNGIKDNERSRSFANILAPPDKNFNLVSLVTDNKSRIVFGYMKTSENNTVIPENIMYLGRVLPDGTADHSFGKKGTITRAIGDYELQQMIVASNDSVYLNLVAHTSYWPYSKNKLNGIVKTIRYTEKGKSDSSIGNSTVTSNQAGVDPDVVFVAMPAGGFLRAWRTKSTGNQPAHDIFFLESYTSRGGKRWSMNSDNSNLGKVLAIGVRNQEQIYLVDAPKQSERRFGKLRLSRYFSNGSIDRSFGQDGHIAIPFYGSETYDTEDVTAGARIVFGTDDKILIAHDLCVGLTFLTRIDLAKNRVDPTYQKYGYAAYSSMFDDVFLMPDGGTMVIGESSVFKLSR